MNDTSNPNQGPGGTTRVDGSAPGGPPAGPGGTQRVEAGPGGTQRVDAGPGGTSRVGVGPGGTAIVNGTPTPTAGEGSNKTTMVSDSAALASGATLRVGDDKTPGAASTASQPRQLRFVPGARCTLNGVDYEVQGELTTTTTEAITYRLRGADSVRFLKLYRRGIRPPGNVLERLRGRPHANVVRLHDFGVVEGQHFEIMDLYEGGNLQAYLRAKGAIRDLNALRGVVKGILGGLDHLHSVGVIYQDLKPENILLTRETAASGQGFERLALSDFGISSLMEAGQTSAVVLANGTKEYAAPELARFGNETQTLVDGKVDYFALGITLLECWNGRRPFEGEPDAKRLAQVRNKEVPFPPDMDPRLANLIKGLIHPLPKERFGRNEVLRWLEGKDLQVEYTATRRPYETRSFNDQEAFSTPAELAKLMEKHPSKAADYLYLGRIKDWLDQAKDMDLSTEIEKIMKAYDKGFDAKRAGVVRAIYTLDPERPFVSQGGRACNTLEEIGDAFLAEERHYIDALSMALDPFYLFLQATDDSGTAESMLANYLAAETRELAFNRVVYRLHAGGDEKLKIGSAFYSAPGDFDQAGHLARDELARQFGQANSRALIWLRSLGLISRTDEFGKLGVVDAMEICKAFPWISYRQLNPNWQAVQYDLLDGLLQAGRADLIPTYVAQGLDIDARDANGVTMLQRVAQDASAVSLFDLLQKAGAKIDATDSNGWPALLYALCANNAVVARRLIDLGANVRAVASDGNSALLLAVSIRNDELVKAILAKGADPNRANAAGYTPLWAACNLMTLLNNSYPIKASTIAALLDGGADPDKLGGDGRHPLHLSFLQSPADALAAVDVFAKRKSSLNALGSALAGDAKQRVSALINACFAYNFVHQRSSAFLPVIDRLIDAGAGVNQLCEGRAALHHAAQWGDEVLCNRLLVKGADRKLPSSEMRLPAAYAAYANAPALAARLDPGTSYQSRRLAWTSADIAARALMVLALLVLLPGTIEAWRTLQPSDALRLAGGYLLIQAFQNYALLALAGSLPAYLVKLKATLQNVRGAVTYLLLLPLLIPGLLALLEWRLRGLALEPREGPLSWLYAQRQALTSALAADPWMAPLVLVPVLAGFAAAAMYVASRARKFEVLAAGASWHQGTAAGAQSGWSKMTASLKPAGNMLRKVAFVLLSPLIILFAIQLWGVFDESVRKASLPRFGAAQTTTMPAETRGGAAKPQPRPPLHSAAAQPAPAVPGPTAVVKGAVASLSAQGWPVLEGNPAPLWLDGVLPIPVAQQEKLKSFLASQGNTLQCERSGVFKYRCVTPGGTDVAEALLLNGAATAAPGARKEYTDAQQAAQQARRGIWQ